MQVDDLYSLHWERVWGEAVLPSEKIFGIFL